MSRAWQGDRWSPVMSDAIARRLAQQRARLAALTDLTEPAEIDGLLDELATELRRCWAILRDVNQAATDARVRKTLQSLRKAEDDLYARVEATDPNTRSLIEDCWPGGQRFLENVDASDEAMLHQAICNALDQLPVPSRGRPRETGDHASAMLAEQLAVLYQKYSNQAPSRRVDPLTHEESGPYRDYVAAVVEIFPARLRRYKSAPSGSTTKTVDHLVRRGVEHYRNINPKA